MTLVQNKAIPLECIFPKSRFFVVNISQVIGYKYLIVETYQYTRFQIKVTQRTPLMTADELERRRDNGENVFVSFKNATVKPYYSSRTKQLEDSIAADEIILADRDDDILGLD